MNEAQVSYERDLDTLRALAQNKTLVINSSVFNPFFLSGKPFQPFNFSSFKKIYLTNSYIIPFLPYYKRYIERECNCSVYKFPSFWQYLLISDDTVMIVSNEKQMDIVINYMRVVHNFSLPLQRLTERGNNFDQWNLYVIDKVKEKK